MSKSGKNLTDLLDSNRAEILYYVVKHPGCSRAELGNATGLTLASITKIIHTLINCGVIYETGYSEGKKGRRSVGLSFRYDNYKILAVKLSWCEIEMQPYDFTGHAYGKMVCVPFHSVNIETIDQVIRAIADGIAYFTNEFPEIAGIGMAVPGPYYRDSGSILLPPYHLELEKRHYYPLKEKIAEHTNLPIFMEHEADAGALAYYWWLEAPDDKDKVVMNILGDMGVGIGLVDHGEVFTGTNNCSCEMGHISIDYNGRTCPTCGSSGCINAYCSTQSLEMIAQEQLSEHSNSTLASCPKVTSTAIFDAAKQHDEFASSLVIECGRNLGKGILSLLHVFNPNIIVISGIISRGDNLLIEGINESLSRGMSSYTIIPKIKLLPSEINLTLLGAATFGINSMLGEPTRYLSL